MTADDRWITAREAAEYASAGVTTIRYAAQAGELRGVQKGKRGHWRFRRVDVDRWLEGLPPRVDQDDEHRGGAR